MSELCQLRVGDIDGHADRMCVRVVQGKGAKDRYVPLPADVLQLLRAWWRLGHPRALAVSGAKRCRPSRWTWTAPSAGTARPAPIAGITKQGGIHTLRHCYATHLLEAGVDLHSLSQWLGHRHVSTTMRYLHLARPDAPDGARRLPLALLTALPSPHRALTGAAVATTLAEVLRHFGPEYLRSHALSTRAGRAWRAIVGCRTPALGGQLLRCDGCGAQQWRWHSCRNRHCPQCQARRATPGAPPGWPSCWMCRTAIWCSRCRTSSTRWQRRTRAGSTTR